MLFSVIIPFLNESPYIEDCVRSVLDQDLERSEYEIILVDNGSTDGSKELVQQFDKIILLEEKEKGAYAARNKGLQAAKGDIVAFTDADCVVSPTWLSQIQKGMLETGASIVLGSRYFPEDSSRELSMLADYENVKVEYTIAHLPPAYFMAYTNNMAVRRSLFETTGLFTPLERSADTEFVHRAVKTVPDVKIAFLAAMMMTHLEITSVKMWFERIQEYSRHNKVIERSTDYTGLRSIHKFRIFRLCAKKHNYGIARTILFLFLLIRGNLLYNRVQD